MKTRAIKYYEYCRKSSEDNKERQMQSIESQEKELRRLIEEQHLEVVGVFKEEKSAHTRGRIEFGKMMSGIEDGKANAILVWHGNRLARNALDGGWIITAMDEGKLLEIKTPHRTYYNTPDDKFFLQLEFGISKKDSDDKSVVVKRGLKMKSEKGWMPGVAPIGYLNTPNLAGGSRYILKDPERFDVLKKVWEMMASGQHSVSNIHKIITDDWGFTTRQFKRQGGKPITISMLYRMFSDTFYFGKFEFPRGSGEYYFGKHEPMITEEIFNRVQYLIQNKGNAKPKTKKFAYTGTMWCGECGARITASEKWKHQKNGNVHHYILYHCTKRKDPNCSQLSISEPLLEEQIKDAIDSISIPQDFHEFALKWFKKQNEKESESKGVVLGAQQRAYTLCIKKLDGLIDMRAAGEITDEEYRNKKEETLKEKAHLEAILNGTGQRTEQWMALAEDVFHFAENAKKRFETGDMQTKKQIFSALGLHLSLKDKILSISYDNVLFPIQEIAKEIKRQNDRFAPPNNFDTKGKTDDFSSVSPTLLRGSELNRRPKVMSLVRYRFSTPRTNYTSNFEIVQSRKNLQAQYRLDDC